MKTLFRHILAALALPAVLLGTACSDSGDDSEATLKLRADKTALTADGADQARFTVTMDGADVTSAATIRCTTTGETLSGAAFTATQAGEYAFVATLDGEESNIVTLTATAPTGPVRDHYTRVLGMQFTSVGCVNCPALSVGIKDFEQKHPDELVTVALHGDLNIADPMKIDINKRYEEKFNVGGYPTYVLNMRTDSPSPVTGDQIAEAVAAQREKAPAVTGIAVATTYDAASREAKIEVKIASSKTESFRYLIFLVEDGIAGIQYGYEGTDTYIHNNVLRAVLSTNVYGDRLNNGAALAAGSEAAVTRTRTLDKTWESDNVRVVVATLRTEDNDATWFCDNVATCKLGGSVDYKYND